MSVRIVPGQVQAGEGAEDVRSLFSTDDAPASRPDPAAAQSGEQASPHRAAAGFPRPPRRRLARLALRPPAALSGWSPGGWSWTRMVTWLLLVVVGCGVLGGLAWRLSIPAPGATPSAPQPTPAAVGGPSARDGGGAPGTAPAATETAAVTAVPWQGAALPISATDGPMTFTATRSTGFSRTRLGAALAAAHISTHIDPYTGPAVFVPAIAEQVVGGGSWLPRRTKAVYSRAARQMDVSGGAPILVPTGSIQSWFLPAEPLGPSAEAELLVATPDGRQVVYHVPLRWQRGDWRLVAPQRAATEIFRVSEPDRTDRFIPFIDYPGGGS